MRFCYISSILSPWFDRINPPWVSFEDYFKFQLNTENLQRKSEGTEILIKDC